MKICLIGPGCKPIPPNGWGAIESVIWDYYMNLKTEHEVTILNNPNLREVINQVNNTKYDIVHIMYDDHVIITPHLLCKNIYYTSHYAYITQDDFEKQQQWYFNNIFLQVINNKDKLKLCVISKEIKEVYIKYGFDENNIYVIHNGAREDVFEFHDNPKLQYKSIYLAKIEERKKQYLYQSIQNIDFVGNYHNSSFDVNNTNYIGEWSKTHLYSHLSHYGNLVLLSDGEADPLVVKEALICGLGVVVSEAASANLDRTLAYITVIPNNKLTDLQYITNEIDNNRQISIENRVSIHEYGITNFSWKNVVNRYKGILTNTIYK
tara:strand:- start:582 stop:1544 length:963 start_codon:yes stop_codon:yes gene_type:complete